MILYAKSSLELIVNNRIGKVGIRPDGRPPSASHHRRYHPAAHPFSCPPAARWPSPSLRNASHLAPESARCRSAARPSVCLSVRPSVRPCRSTVRRYVRIYVRTRTCPRAISARNINACMYTRLYIRGYVQMRVRYRHVRALPTYVLLRINA